MFKKQIPNFLTLLNLFFGCLAIMSTFQAGAMASIDSVGDMIVEIPEPIFYASLFIGLAAFFLNYIPTFGAIITAIPAVLLCLAVNTWQTALMMLGRARADLAAGREGDL